jgi:hypothetical protein
MKPYFFKVSFNFSFSMQKALLSMCLLWASGFVMAQRAAVKVGQPCPNVPLEIMNRENTLKRLSDFQGSVILMHFWGLGSDSSLHWVAVLSKLEKKYSKLVVLAVSDGKLPHDSLGQTDGAAIDNFIKIKKIGYRVVLDRKDFLYSLFSNGNHPALPYNVLIDKDGYVLSLNPTLGEIEEVLQEGRLIKIGRGKN